MVPLRSPLCSTKQIKDHLKSILDTLKPLPRPYFVAFYCFSRKPRSHQDSEDKQVEENKNELDWKQDHQRVMVDPMLLIA